jgi:PAS domain S-box-containing protein
MSPQRSQPADTTGLEVKPGVIVSYLVGILLVLSVSVLALIQLNRIKTTVTDLTDELSANRELAHEIMQQVLLARFYVHTYVGTEKQIDADRFTTEFGTLTRLLSQATTQIATPKRREMLDRIKSAADQYGKTFDTATQLVQERQRLESEVLYIQSRRITLKLTALHVHIVTLADPLAFLAFGNAQEAVHQMQLSTAEYISTTDEKATVHFDRAYEDAQEAFAVLQTVLSDTAQRQNIDQALAAADAYHEGFHNTRNTTIKLGQLLNTILEDIEPEISTMAADIVAGIHAEYEAKSRSTQAQLAQAQAVLIFTASIAITAGLLLGGLTLRRLAEREQGAAALRQSERQYRTLFEGVPIGLYRILPEGDLLDANPALVEILGYRDRDAIVGTSGSNNYLYEEDRQRFRLQIETEGFVRNYETQMRRQNGTVIWTRENAHAVYDDLGQITYYEGSLEDMTEQKAADAALRTAHDELEQKVEHRTVELLLANEALRSEIGQRKEAESTLMKYSERLEEMVDERTRALETTQEALVRREKLAVLGQLAGGVGHDLRNPLGVISNAVYFLNMVLSGADDSVKESLGIILNEVEAAESIVSDLLDFARVRNSERQPTDAIALIKETLSRCPLPDAVAVEADIPSDVPQVDVDARQIERVLINVITNAHQAMEDGGVLTIGAAQDEHYVSISVGDTGVGIPQEDLNRIFEPLFTTKAKGIGLGLAITKSLVEANGGIINVQSTVGTGSTFVIALPKSQVPQ